MKLFTTGEFCRYCLISRSTLNRKLQKNPKLRKYIKKEGRNNLIDGKLYKYFKPTEMEKAYEDIEKKYYKLIKLLKKIHSPANKQEVYGNTYWKKKWSLMGTVSFRYNSVSQAMDRMGKYAEHLKETYTKKHKDLKIDVLYVVESYSEKYLGEYYHSHFVLFVSNPELVEEIKRDFNVWFKDVLIKEIKKYCVWQGYVFYMFKHEDTINSKEVKWNHFNCTSEKRELA